MFRSQEVETLDAPRLSSQTVRQNLGTSPPLSILQRLGLSICTSPCSYCIVRSKAVSCLSPATVCTCKCYVTNRRAEQCIIRCPANRSKCESVLSFGRVSRRKVKRMRLSKVRVKSGILDDLRGRLTWYKDDWKQGFNCGFRCDSLSRTITSHVNWPLCV